MEEKNLLSRPDNFKITVDYVSNKVFDSLLSPYENVIDSAVESRKKNIESNIWIINTADKQIQIGEFERAVLNAAIAEIAEGRTFTTAKRIFKRLGGNTHFLNLSMKNAILEAFEKLSSIRVVIEATKAVQKGIVDDSNIIKANDDKLVFRGYLLPTESFQMTINGQTVDAIGFLKNATTDKIKKGVICTNAEAHDHIITCEQDLLLAPIKSTPRNIALNHYLLRRTLSIKGSNLLAADNKHKKPLRKTILIDDMLEHCGLAEYSKDQQKRLLTIARKILDYFISQNIISNYHFETIKGTGKIYSIILDF